MSNTSTTVISVGANPELMRLRDLVLQEGGFNVISTLHEHDALARIERGDCGVLLMCDFLPRSVRQKLADAFRNFCPGKRIVAIVNERTEKPDFADTFIYGVEGQEALITEINGSMNAES
jgi:hypothetical protein